MSLWADAEQTKYRSLKDYLGDIATIWDEIDAKSQTELLEGLFGKRGASVGSAILGNFDQVEKAIEEMENAAGKRTCLNIWQHIYRIYLIAGKT